MADITLISGSTLGSAEYVAEHLAEKLEEAGYSTEIQHGPLVDDLQAQGIWLIISSTYGYSLDNYRLIQAFKHGYPQKIGRSLQFSEQIFPGSQPDFRWILRNFVFKDVDLQRLTDLFCPAGLQRRF